MASHELVDLRLARRVQVLELVHSLELDDVQPIGEYPIWLPLEEMLAFVRRDMRHGREHVSAMCGGALNAVAVVDTALPRFVIDIEVLEVVVEVD
jgi:hypothetical protein